MVKSPVFLAALAFAAAAALSLGVAVVAATTVERRSTEAVRGALADEGFGWVLVDADGLQVFLEGAAPDEASRFLAESLAARVVDANRVVNHMMVAPRDVRPAPRFSLSMLRNGEGIQIIGLVPDEDGGRDVASAIEAIADGAEVTDMVETADYPAPDTWITALSFGLRALRALPRSKVTVLADRVEVEAISDSAEQQAELMAMLSGAQPAGVDVVLDISAPRPVIAPYQLRAVSDADGMRLETCAAETAEAEARIVDAATAAGVSGEIDCLIALGAPSPSWPEAVEQGLAALGEMGGGTLDFTDADVTLIAAQGTDQDEFDRIIGELDAALPELFTLTGTLPQTTTVAGPARLFATLDPEEGMRLRGRLPEGPVGTSVEAFALAVFGQDRTDVATRTVSDLPQGWSVRAMAGLRALSQLHAGRMTLDPDTLSLEGSTGDQALRSEIARRLSEELGAGAEFQLDIVYDEALDPIASQPTPEECVAAIVAVQEDDKIVFDPGSVEITVAAGAILDRIAEILPDCAHVEMEIGGHTDSQGREEMNLGLSQRRADAVLNGLLARGVLISNLTARGYGESRPIADNGTEAGRELNRRIEFRLQADVDARNAAVAEAEATAALREIYGRRPLPRPDSIVAAAAADRDEE